MEKMIPTRKHVIMHTMLKQKVEETIRKKELLQKGDHVVLGVSGGPDSACLLSLLWELREEWGLSLYAVHVHHGLRGQDADEDSRYTEKLCSQFSVPCRILYYDVKKMAGEKSLTTEEMGRELRYDAFEALRQEILDAADGVGLRPEQVKIAVAHNRNDQAETVLMRLLRGTGVDGLAGIGYMREGNIVRPLLDADRSEIESYCEEKELNPRTDLTNLEPDYTRNRIRLELIPYLQREYNEKIVSGLCRLAANAAEDKAFLSEQTELAFQKIGKIREGEDAFSGGRCCSLECSGFSELRPAVSKRLIRRGLREMGLIQDVTASQLEAADAMMRSGRTGDRLDFPHGYRLEISYGEGLLRGPEKTGEKESEKFSFLVNVPGITQFPALNAFLRVQIVTAEEGDSLDMGDSCRILASADPGLWDQPLFLRSRQPGDFIVPLGMQGSKKMQDYFVDRKIPRESRDAVPLLCRGMEVVWIPGGVLNEKYRAEKDAERLVFVEYIRLPC